MNKAAVRGKTKAVRESPLTKGVTNHEGPQRESNNCKNQSQNRTTNQTTNEHKHPNQYTKGADDEGAKNKK